MIIISFSLFQYNVRLHRAEGCQHIPAALRHNYGSESCNKTNDKHQFLKFIFGIELYMFWTVSVSIIRSLALYTQQHIQVIAVCIVLDS
jgi:dipeptide/tripeptide permease